MKDKIIPDLKELLNIINNLKKEIDYLKEENDIYMKQIELLVRKNNNIKRRNDSSAPPELNSIVENLRHLLPDFDHNTDEDNTNETDDHSKKREDKIKPVEAKSMQAEGKLMQREENLKRMEEKINYREDSIDLIKKLVNPNNDEFNESEDLINAGEDSMKPPEDNIKTIYNSRGSSEGIITDTESTIKIIKGREKHIKSDLKDTEDSSEEMEEVKPINKDNVTITKGSIKIIQDRIKHSGNAGITDKDSKNAADDRINSQKKSIKGSEDGLTVHGKDVNRKIDEEILSGDYELVTEDSIGSKLPVPSEKDRMPELIKMKPNLHEPSREVKELRKRLEENLTLTFRKRYLKQMIRRWVNELIYFSEHERVKGAELMYAMGIRPATLMRDTTLFKNKGWIKYHGTKKNGYYKMTEEGMEFVNQITNYK